MAVSTVEKILSRDAWIKIDSGMLCIFESKSKNRRCVSLNTTPSHICRYLYIIQPYTYFLLLPCRMTRLLSLLGSCHCLTWSQLKHLCEALLQHSGDLCGIANVSMLCNNANTLRFSKYNVFHALHLSRANIGLINPKVKVRPL